MNSYILDTDHLTLHQRGHKSIGAKMSMVPFHQVSITIITAEEQLRGRFAQIRKAVSSEGLTQAYFWFHETLDFLKDCTVLDFDQAAAQHFESLRQQKIRIGTQDLRIAAIVLVTDGTLVTRNRKDFMQVPQLIIEDWSQPEP